MSFKDSSVNDALLLFVKLFGHYSHGGTLILNTQCSSDLHYAFKRCIPTYTFLYRSINLPFFMLVRFKIMYLDDSGNNVNVQFTQADDSLSWCLIPKRYLKKYDCYAYSILTDNLPIQKSKFKLKNSLKAYYIPSFVVNKKLLNEVNNYVKKM